MGAPARLLQRPTPTELRHQIYRFPSLVRPPGPVPFHTQNSSQETRTESFGGHWGPAFFTYFHEQNEKLDQNTTTAGRKLNMKSLGMVNAIVDEPTQTEYLLRFTRENTYGLQLINDTVYDHGDFALRRPGGCQEKLDYCAWLDRESLTRRVACSAAQFICQADVEGLYYTFGLEGRGTYDIVSCSQPFALDMAVLTVPSARSPATTYPRTTGA